MKWDTRPFYLRAWKAISAGLEERAAKPASLATYYQAVPFSTSVPATPLTWYLFTLEGAGFEKPS